MNHDDLNQLERETGLRLPARYRRVLLHYPQELIDVADVYPVKKGPPSRVGPETVELYKDLSLLRLRNIGDASYKNEIFPPGFFIVGESGCGDYYAIDTADANAAVYESGCHHAPLPYQRIGDTLVEVDPPRIPDFHVRVTNSIEEWVEYLIQEAPKAYRQLPLETEAESRRKQALKSAVSEADEAFRSKDYARVVRLLAPFEDELPEISARKLALARKRQ